ncbi:MAG: GHKL domain-containing protein [Candidatus Omnitrophica bacterium]|nr:GHKL domain-containing protein [Candidatus Omnitrophota bacterium]MCB9720904.1 GHKL domain-containing protein [Candidatus Omnitrophota bacterium]
MKWLKSIFWAFGLIFLVAVIGLITNVKRLGEIAEYYEQINAESGELETLSQFQVKINDFMTYVSFHQVVKRPLVESMFAQLVTADELIGQIERSMSAADNVLLERGFHPDPDELGLFRQFRESFLRLRNLIQVQMDGGAEFTDRDIDAILKHLHDLQSYAFNLEQLHVAEVQKALAALEAKHGKIVEQTILFSWALAAILGLMALLSALIVRRQAMHSMEKQNLLTIGALTKHLVHEIRNPLGIIKSSASVLQPQISDDPTNSELIGYMIDEIDRVDNILSHLLTLTEDDKAAFEETSVPELIHKVRSLLKGRIRNKKIYLNYINDTNGTRVRCHPNLMQQALINILLNAIEASGDGQSIDITTREEDGDYVIQVADHGRGMDREQLKHARETFYTTKNTGMGLGIPIVQRIMERHRGRLDINSQTNKGTVMTLRLPMGGEAA